MTYRETDNILQWIGAVAIIIGHILNTLGSQYHGDFWNIIAFAIGTIAFLLWSIRVANKPQMMVNVVAMTTCTVGVIKALV